MQGELPYRSQCTCPCHQTGAIHIVPCCRPDPVPADPAVAAALRAAVDASFTHDGEYHAPPLHARRERHYRVAHEIAAFLRALPEMGMWDHKKGRSAWLEKVALETLAAAVTRAAMMED